MRPLLAVVWSLLRSYSASLNSSDHRSLLYQELAILLQQPQMQKPSYTRPPFIDPEAPKWLVEAQNSLVSNVQHLQMILSELTTAALLTCSDVSDLCSAGRSLLALRSRLRGGQDDDEGRSAVSLPHTVQQGQLNEIKDAILTAAGLDREALQATQLPLLSEQIREKCHSIERDMWAFAVNVSFQDRRHRQRVIRHIVRVCESFEKVLSSSAFQKASCPPKTHQAAANSIKHLGILVAYKPLLVWMTRLDHPMMPSLQAQFRAALVKQKLRGAAWAFEQELAKPVVSSISSTYDTANVLIDQDVEDQAVKRLAVTLSWLACLWKLQLRIPRPISIRSGSHLSTHTLHRVETLFAMRETITAGAALLDRALAFCSTDVSVFEQLAAKREELNQVKADMEECKGCFDRSQNVYLALRSALDQLKPGMASDLSVAFQAEGVDSTPRRQRLARLV